MILAAIAPACLAVAIFLDVLRERQPTRQERDAVAASAREWRSLVGPLLCVSLLLLAPMTVAALHLFFDRDQAFVQGELR